MGEVNDLFSAPRIAIVAYTCMKQYFLKVDGNNYSYWKDFLRVKVGVE